VGENFTLGLADPPTWLLGVLTVLGLLLGLGLWRRRPWSRDQAAMPLAVVAVFCLGLPLLLALADRDFVLTRSLLPVAVPLVLLLALGLARAGLRWGAAISAALCLLWGGIAFATQTDPALQRPDWRELGRSLPRPPHDRLVVASDGLLSLPLLRYLPAARPLRNPEQPRVSEIVEVNYADPRVAACGLWVASTCGSSSISIAAGGGFQRVSSVRAGLFSIVRLRAQRPRPAGLTGPGVFFQRGTSSGSVRP
jgi:hypothetical protein